MFFLAVGGQPRVIISDEERAIAFALKQLQENGDFKGVHMLDSYHILHNIYKKLKGKSEITYFSNMIHSKNEAELSKHV